MTLRSDVAGLLAGAGIVDVDVEDAVADEHVRGAVYRRVVSAAVSSGSRDAHRAVVAAILRDPVESVSKTSVVALVDGVATGASGLAEFQEWSAELLPRMCRFEAAGHVEFVRRRVHDWLFHLSVQDGHVPTAAELAEVTDWMQRVLAEESTSPAVLALLAESGNRKKTRNIATNRARSLGRSGPGHLRPSQPGDT